MRGGRAHTVGMFSLSLATAQFSALGVQVLVHPVLASTQTVVSDAHGEHVHAQPLPGDPALSGMQLFAQAVWFDPCFERRFSSTAGLALTLRP